MPAKINDGLTNGMRYYWRHKEACDAAAVAWRENNRELLQGIKRRWQLKNGDKCIVANRAYYARHKERKAAEKREWRKVHPKEAAEIKKRWMQKHPEMEKAIRVNKRIRRRKRETLALGNFTAKDLIRLKHYQKDKCYWCKTALNGKYHVDHIWPLAKGGSNESRNICLACPPCNLSKRDKTPAEFAGRLF